MNYKLVDRKFKDVTLGSVFYSEKYGSRLQKVDQPLSDGTQKYGNKFNAQGNFHRVTFEADDIVRIPKFVSA